MKYVTHCSNSPLILIKTVCVKLYFPMLLQHLAASGLLALYTKLDLDQAVGGQMAIRYIYKYMALDFRYSKGSIWNTAPVPHKVGLPTLLNVFGSHAYAFPIALNAHICLPVFICLLIRQFIRKHYYYWILGIYKFASTRPFNQWQS